MVFNVDNAPSRVTFTNVLYVPTLAINLLSASALQKAGLSLEFPALGNQAKVKDGPRTVITASRSNGLYQIDTMPEGSMNALHMKVEYVDLLTMHRRLGHVGKGRILEM
ncbi:hypothetical protein HD553DRAFT_266677, partial [Filobasidium floriforme]|uniref:uncharacterized protein n=1 Tax=Filobasidium floriforme TaxID=5210 RepID=UPI001E8EA0B5